jgi:hypothetical protein
MTAQEFIAENCKASILREFPSEYLDLTICDILSGPQSTKQKRVKSS